MTTSLTDKIDALEQRVALLEKLQSDGLDVIIREIQRLGQNDAVLGSAVESHDNLIAALRAILVDGKVITDAQVTAQVQKIEEIRVNVEKEHRRQAELGAIQARAREAALEDAGHPKEAFIFGG